MSLCEAACVSHDECNTLWMSVIEHQGFIIKDYGIYSVEGDIWKFNGVLKYSSQFF